MAKASDKQLSKNCFVICPIGSEESEERRHSDNLFHDVVEEALKPLGFDEIIRADKVENPGSINDQIINYILRADLIVADLSFHNPNAFYEMGIADHAGKVTVLFCRKGERIPFDKSHDRVIISDLGNYHDRRRARQSIAKFAEAAMKPDFNVSNPVTHAKAYQEIEASADPRDKVIVDLQRSINDLKNQFYSLEPNKKEKRSSSRSSSERIYELHNLIGVTQREAMTRSQFQKYFANLTEAEKKLIKDTVSAYMETEDLPPLAGAYVGSLQEALN